MSKLFASLGRSDESPTEASLPESTVSTFEQPNQHRSWVRSAPDLLLAVVIDAGFVLLALVVFWGFVSAAIARRDVLTLMVSLPCLLSVSVGLAVAYWLLFAILGRRTPGTDFARGRRSLRSDPSWSSEVPALRPIQEQLLGPESHPRPFSHFRRSPAEELALASQLLTAEGVLDVHGSVSIRDAGNPSRIMFAGPEITKYDLNGRLAADWSKWGEAGQRNSGHPDRFIHCEIYRARPDVGAIVVSSAPELISFAASSVALRPIVESADFLSSGVPVFESRQIEAVTDQALRARAIAQALAETLSDKSAALIHGRGAVIVGPSLQVAASRAFYMRMNARLQAQCILLGGTVRYLESRDVPTATFERAWESWKQKVSG
jgi:HCOMODA/2-hydroxy-3-carboxy-muconic semialdehyde decarboxylase